MIAFLRFLGVTDLHRPQSSKIALRWLVWSDFGAVFCVDFRGFRFLQFSSLFRFSDGRNHQKMPQLRHSSTIEGQLRILLCLQTKRTTKKRTIASQEGQIRQLPAMPNSP
jgi:hypothetical protein